MQRFFLVVIFVFGCGSVAKVSEPTKTGSFASSWTPERCQRLLDQRDGLMWATAFGGGLTGAGGLSAAIPDDSQKDVRIGLGITSAVIAAATSSLIALAKAKSSEFEQYCNVEPEAIVAEVVFEQEDEPIDAEFVEIKVVDTYPDNGEIDGGVL